MKRIVALTPLAALACLAGALAGAPEMDAPQVPLNLMVTDCEGVALDGAAIGVTLYRPGEGILAYSAGETESGYVEFNLSGLQCNDEARVTVTPEGGTPDSDHVYVYIGNCGSKGAGNWDLGAHLYACDDWWWGDTAEGEIIHTIYEVDAD